MKIACLQFAPQVGDTNNNLNRADAVLNKAADVEDLDLLVLPELAFTGYNFQSLAHISPHLEPSVSGISSLWARTTALKFNCNVIVGYPEKVDVAHKWPANPEFYNTAVVVGRDGETVGNYRKSFLYAVDETWALEGQDGFYAEDIPGLGSLALGICMDLNPYKFEAPWDAFEFAYHVLEVRANLVVVSMAWLTREDAATFTQLPHEPDMETLEYWIQRLEPVIRSSSSMNPATQDEEVIVVFCNRAGIEGDAVYAGTSAVIGVHDGEVNLYGILGRGVKELLVVDTSLKPFARLVRSDPDGGGDVQQQQQQQQEHSSEETQPRQDVPHHEPTGPSPTLERTIDRNGDGAGNRGRGRPTGGRSLSPTSMFNFPPSSPHSAFIANDGINGINGINGNRTAFGSNENRNGNSNNRHSNEFISPLSTEASWKRWEQASGEGLLSAPAAHNTANTAASLASSVLHRRSQTWLAASRPSLPALEVQVVDSDRRNSIGAFRDAVGSPPAGEVEKGFKEATAMEPSPKKMSSPRRQRDRKGPTTGLFTSPLTGGSGGSGSRQRHSNRHEKKTDRKSNTKTLDKTLFSPPLTTWEASLRNEPDRHTSLESSIPIIFDPFPSASSEGGNALRLRRSRSTESWGSMTGNSSASNDSGDRDARLIKSAHPGHGSGYRDFQDFHQQQQSLFSPSSSHLDSNPGKDEADMDLEPEQYYLAHSNEQRHSHSNDYAGYDDEKEEADYQDDDEDEDAAFYVDDELQYISNSVAMSELMRVLQPHEQQQEQNHSSTPSAPPGVTAPTPLRPTSTKSRNTSLPRPGDNSALFRPVSNGGPRLSRSASQPQMNVPLMFTPRNLHLEERQQQRQEQQQQEQKQQKQKQQTSRNNSTQRTANAAIYFRPDSNFKGNRTDQDQGKDSGLGHTRRTSETRTGRSLSATAQGKNDPTAPPPATNTRPYSRGRQPTSTQAAEMAEVTTPSNHPTSVWPTGRSGSRLVSGNEYSRLPATASPFTSALLTNANVANNASTAAPHRERASSAMSFKSGTSFASSAMATESWLEGTPAPPVLRQLQQQQQQQARPASASATASASASTSASASARPANPDDDIVAMISLVNRGCPVHRGHGGNRHHGHGQENDADGQRPSGSAALSRNRQQHRRGASLSSPTNQQLPRPSSSTATPGTAPLRGQFSTPAQDDSIYEVFLPPHIRDLVESLSDPSENHPLRRRQAALGSPQRGGSALAGSGTTSELHQSRGTPKFDPPTPTAMQFNSDAASPEAATTADATDTANAAVELPKTVEPAAAG